LRGFCLRLAPMKVRAPLVRLVLMGSVAARGAAATNELLIIEGDLEVTLATGIANYKNGMLLKYGDEILTANTARINRATGDAYAEGNVILQREGGQLWRGEQLHYNYKTRVLGGDTLRSDQPPYFVGGDHLITEPSNQT